jgi:predicted transcriptional regulator
MPARRPVARQDLLSPSEWKVFWVLSKRNPLTMAEISQELARHDPDFSLNDNTVRTFVKRLEQKGYLKSESAGRLSYRPSVPFELALRFHVDRFLEQFALGGREDLEVIRQVVEERLKTSIAG